MLVETARRRCSLAYLRSWDSRVLRHGIFGRAVHS